MVVDPGPVPNPVALRVAFDPAHLQPTAEFVYYAWWLVPPAPEALELHRMIGLGSGPLSSLPCLRRHRSLIVRRRYCVMRRHSPIHSDDIDLRSIAPPLVVVATGEGSVCPGIWS